MNRQPFFSVIIPTYNRLSLCIETLESALAQSFDDYEVIIIDDGSTDGTREHFSTITEPKLTYVYQENSGVSTARNHGIKKARGEYICYLDSDDLWKQDKLFKMHDVIIANPNSDVFFHDFVKHDIKNTNPYDLSNSKMFSRIYSILNKCGNRNQWESSAGDAFNLVLSGYPFYPSVITVKRSVHDQYLWDPGVLKSEDYNLILKLSLKYKFTYFDECLTTVKVHENNKSKDTKTKDTVILNTTASTMHLYTSGEVKRLFKRTLASKYFHSGMGQFKTGNYLLGLRWIISSLINPHFYLNKLAKK
jgi:glycosyltransferase involved in cell wall biosynthesis